jgi:hypothetical protein
LIDISRSGLAIFLFLISLFLQEKLKTYILACQDAETGGFADRPGDMVIEIGSFLLKSQQKRIFTNQRAKTTLIF